MDMDAVTETMGHIERKYSVDLERAKSQDERDKIEILKTKETYKEMKKLDRQNERASPK